jgi:hypothetical protein
MIRLQIDDGPGLVAGFVRIQDEGCGIERVAWRFVGQAARRKLAQLIVNQQ